MKISWIDLSNNDVKSAREFLDYFKESGTIDHLGLGLIRDRLADHFFPAISTIMTRAAYFYLVPLALTRAQKEAVKVGAKTPEHLLNILVKEEMKIGKNLLVPFKNSAEITGMGIIGGQTLFETNKMKFVDRTPSEIYWASLQKLRIIPVLGRTNRETFLMELIRDSKRGTSGDLIGELELSFNKIDKAVLQLMNLTIGKNLELHDRQKEDLFRRFEDQKDLLGEKALISILLEQAKNKNIFSANTGPWELIQYAPVKMRDLLKETKWLSELTYGANLAYNLLLSQSEIFKNLNDDIQFQEDSIKAKEHWKDWLDQKIEIINFPISLEVSKKVGSNMNDLERAYKFIEDFATIVSKSKGKSSQKLLNELKDLIRLQELSVKRKSARLAMQLLDEKIAWPGLQGELRPDFRMQISRRIMADICGVQL